jgi:transcriptional regulator with PAS, ATPase and Fis domain
VVAATNRPLRDHVEEGSFRADLYYRLNVLTIYLPPLRERPEDIPLLVRKFVREFSQAHGREFKGISAEAMQILAGYSWPGNVRELRNTMERAVIVCESSVIETKHLPPGFGHAPARSAALDPNALHLGVGTTVEEAERQLIIKTLEATNNNKTRAAEILQTGAGHHRHDRRAGGAVFLHLHFAAAAPAHHCRLRHCHPAKPRTAGCGYGRSARFQRYPS